MRWTSSHCCQCFIEYSRLRCSTSSLLSVNKPIPLVFCLLLALRKRIHPGSCGTFGKQWCGTFFVVDGWNTLWRPNDSNYLSKFITSLSCKIPQLIFLGYMGNILNIWETKIIQSMQIFMENNLLMRRPF